MNEDRISGNAEKVAGYAGEKLGQVTGDVRTQVQGKARQVEGSLQDLYGQAKDTAANAANVVRRTAGDADDILRTTIEQRPYTAAAIALGIGYLIGRFAHRDSYWH
jgi:uncharacterized protein YjbJ (UPF0337 family)